MTAAERKTLGILGELDVATAGRLAQETGLTTGAITGIVDRLEKAGFARREPNPDDRRSVLIRALRKDKVRKLVGPMFESLSRAVAEMQKRLHRKRARGDRSLPRGYHRGPATGNCSYGIVGALIENKALWYHCLLFRLSQSSAQTLARGKSNRINALWISCSAAWFLMTG